MTVDHCRTPLYVYGVHDGMMWYGSQTFAYRFSRQNYDSNMEAKPQVSPEEVTIPKLLRKSNLHSRAQSTYNSVHLGLKSTHCTVLYVSDHTNVKLPATTV